MASTDQRRRPGAARRAPGEPHAAGATGRYSGAYGAVWSAAYLLGPLGGTRLLALSPAALWLSCALLATAAAAGLLVLAPAIRRRSQAARLPGGGRGGSVH